MKPPRPKPPPPRDGYASAPPEVRPLLHALRGKTVEEVERLIRESKHAANVADPHALAEAVAYTAATGSSPHHDRPS